VDVGVTEVVPPIPPVENLYTLLSTALNVVQTLFLAYLASAARKSGQSDG
jgi:hypothetical protein